MFGVFLYTPPHMAGHLFWLILTCSDHSSFPDKSPLIFAITPKIQRWQYDCSKIIRGSYYDSLYFLATGILSVLSNDPLTHHFVAVYSFLSVCRPLCTVCFMLRQRSFLQQCKCRTRKAKFRFNNIFFEPRIAKHTLQLD